MSGFSPHRWVWLLKARHPSPCQLSPEYDHRCDLFIISSKKVARSPPKRLLSIRQLLMSKCHQSLFQLSERGKQKNRETLYSWALCTVRSLTHNLTTDSCGARVNAFSWGIWLTRLGLAHATMWRTHLRNPAYTFICSVCVWKVAKSRSRRQLCSFLQGGDGSLCWTYGISAV